MERVVWCHPSLFCYFSPPLNAWWAFPFGFQEDFHFWELEGKHRFGHVGADCNDWQVSRSRVLLLKPRPLLSIRFFKCCPFHHFCEQISLVGGLLRRDVRWPRHLCSEGRPRKKRQRLHHRGQFGFQIAAR